MIKDFENLKYEIIPKIREGDTIIIYIKSDKWPLDEVEESFRMFQKEFPNNQVLLTFDDWIKIGVKHENK